MTRLNAGNLLSIELVTGNPGLLWLGDAEDQHPHLLHLLPGALTTASELGAVVLTPGTNTGVVSTRTPNAETVVVGHRELRSSRGWGCRGDRCYYCPAGKRM